MNLSELPPTIIELKPPEREEFSTDKGDIGRQIDLIKWFMIVVIMVLFVAFAGLINDYYHTRAVATQDLADKINEQNTKIDLLFDELHKANSELLKIKPLLEVKEIK